MILITTSHRPSPRLRSFVKDLSAVLPYSVKVNRGKKTMEELCLEASARGLRYIAVVSERRGNPGKIDIYELGEGEAGRVVPKKIATLILKGVRLSREDPEAIRLYNPSSVTVNYSGCLSDECYGLADVFLKIFRDILKERGDVVIVLEDSGYLILGFRSPHGKRAGPTLKILKAVFHERAQG